MARHMRRCPPFAWISSRILTGYRISERTVESWRTGAEGCESVRRGGKGDSGIKSERKQRVDPKQVVAEGGGIIANWESTPSPREIQTMTKPPPPIDYRTTPRRANVSGDACGRGYPCVIIVRPRQGLQSLPRRHSRGSFSSPSSERKLEGFYDPYGINSSELALVRSFVILSLATNFFFFFLLDSRWIEFREDEWVNWPIVIGCPLRLIFWSFNRESPNLKRRGINWKELESFPRLFQCAIQIGIFVWNLEKGWNWNGIRILRIFF